MSTREMALIVAEPGRLAESLAALLMATHYVAETMLVSSQDRTLAALSRCGPIVMVLALGETARLLRAIKATRPETLCVVLANDPAADQAAREAGADLAFVTGYPAPRLYQALCDLLERRERGD